MLTSCSDNLVAKVYSMFGHKRHPKCVGSFFELLIVNVAPCYCVGDWTNYIQPLSHFYLPSVCHFLFFPLYPTVSYFLSSKTSDGLFVIYGMCCD